MQLPVHNLAGEVVRNIDVSDRVFGQAFNEAVVHQAMVRQQANARQGTASTKERGEVAGSTRKLYAQKHTGNARRGSRRSPLLRGGGKVGGPKPRSYRQAMPKKMHQLALRCMLSVKAGNGELKVVEELDFAEPKTREMVSVLNAFGWERSALVVTGEMTENVVKSARNLAGVKTLPANLLNVVDLLSNQLLLMTESAVRQRSNSGARNRLKEQSVHQFEVLRRPLITEKTTELQAQSKYAFEIARGANKQQVKEAVEKAFTVKVTAVNVMTVRGKQRRMGRRLTMTPPWRKAIVTLRQGDKIAFFEGV